MFGDSRLYAFYARPAYRSSKAGPLNNINFAPVCFILDPSIADGPYPVEVFPFDTGALSEDILADHVHSELSPFDFSLEPKISSAQCLASVFFETERNYFSARPVGAGKVTCSPKDAELVAYLSLLTRPGGHRQDERSTSIEFQFKDKLSTEDRLLAVILPQDFLDVPEVYDAFKKKGIVG